MKDDMFCAAEKYAWNGKVYYCLNYGGDFDCGRCKHYKHKWPTPTQFRKEYGEIPDYMPIWFRSKEDLEGSVHEGFAVGSIIKESRIDNTVHTILIACTPCGNPPADYRPE